MSRRHYNLPPLRSLTAFEAAARHLSFKAAASELSVTPGAVSHQIKALEQELGVPLFLRQHRGVALSSEGQALFETLSTAFGQISRRLEALRQCDIGPRLTIGSTTAVSSLWLSPAIIRFWRDYPDLNIHQVTQDTPFSHADDLDFVIRYGRDRNENLPHTPLFQDELVALAAPSFARTLMEVPLSELAAQRLIHLKSAGRNWTVWGNWFSHFGYDGALVSGPTVTSYSVALQLAAQGAGIVLGWKRLVNPMIRSGELAVVGPYAMAAPRAFYLVEYGVGELSATAEAFKRWIIDNIP